MFRSIVSVLIVAVALVHAAVIDVSQEKNVHLEFTSNEEEQQTKSLGPYPEERGPLFIGDLVAGQRYADETVFRRVIEFNNPTNTIQATTLDVSVTSGSIHYLSARNVQGSQAVVCGHPNELGRSKTSINLRVPPNSLATLNLLVAAHDRTKRWV
ncbi:hypothetical protein WN48_08361 [Eufriesea mexicana]|uniref:Uncharacterized protein n=1 Tax=Eufriesea mexicana TaxID=516756 RepID=A0A310SFD4_9HYME|nr:PREDICTED: uncharacterized protein LOC108551941 [Eufriesea mexicana]OAD54128.1 hypothetical protein WN48_08361 [Eufriesea mexicana]